MRLLNDSVLILPEAPGLKSEVIHVVQNVSEDSNDHIKPCRGVVLLVGPGKCNHKTGMREPMNCKIGDYVRYIDNRNVTLTYEGQECSLLVDTDIIGTYEPNDPHIANAAIASAMDR